MSNENDKKVEAAFQPEDGAEAKPNPPISSSWAQNPDKQREEKRTVPLSQGDILLYIAKQCHDISLKLDEILDRKKKLATIATPTPTETVTQTPVSSSTSTPSIPNLPSILSSTPVPVVDVKLEGISKALKEYIDGELIEIDSTSSNMFYLIKTKKFLGSENFAKIASVVRGLGGQYRSQGKASHFEVSKAN